MFAADADADVGAFFGDVFGSVGLFDGLVVVAESQADRFEFVDDVRLFRRGGVVPFVAQAGYDGLERSLQICDLFGGQPPECFLEHEPGRQQLRTDLYWVAVRNGHGWEWSEQDRCADGSVCSAGPERCRCVTVNRMSQQRLCRRSVGARNGHRVRVPVIGGDGDGVAADGDRFAGLQYGEVGDLAVA